VNDFRHSITYDNLTMGHEKVLYGSYTRLVCGPMRRYHIVR